ncbi:MAG: RDD family protein [Trueperaceae bacterium]|nr:RDD family protein [Trueperaceae bacterium]
MAEHSLPTRLLARQRILAWLNDWLWILILPILIVPVGLLLPRLGVELGELGANLFGFFALVVPVTLWLAWRESAPRAATPGKRRLGLRVVHFATGEGVGFGRALLRNALKVAIPWQLGHQVAFGFATLGDAEIGRALMVVSFACYGVMGVHLAGLFLGDGRTVYDRLSGTRVVR